jgi:probable F420-dependent oxidoreductase
MSAHGDGTDDFRVGVVFPQVEIEPDPGAVRDFAQAIEGMGYHHITIYDHVVGADITNRPAWNRPYTHLSAFLEPLVTIAFMAAATEAVHFMTGVVVLPQRQTVLFAKQAACVDILCRGRLRLGVGTGWNAVEYEALGTLFDGRGERLDDQIRFLRRLWTEPVLTEHGPFHDISEAGINPLPVQRPIPLWVGGRAAAALQRAAELGDGWLPSTPPSRAQETVQAWRNALIATGRSPDAAEIENLAFLGTTLGQPLRPPEDVVHEVEAWKSAGSNGVIIDTQAMGLRGADGHIAMFGTIAALVGLSQRRFA